MKIKKILAANRSEIAIRIFRAAEESGISTAAIYSKEDRFALHRFKTNESYLVGENKGPIQAYLDIDSIMNAAEIINNAKKPMIVWGQGVILGKAEELFKQFIETSGIPAVWTILGLSAIPTSHPLNKGMVGMHGNYGPNILTNECDVLIAVGH